MESIEDPRKITWLERRLRRLDYLATLLEENGFPQMAAEVKSLQTGTEVRNFYEAMKNWIF